MNYIDYKYKWFWFSLHLVSTLPPIHFPPKQRDLLWAPCKGLGLLRCMCLFGMISGDVESNILSPILTQWKVYFGNGGFAYFPFDPYVFPFSPSSCHISAWSFYQFCFHGLHPTRIFSFPPNLSDFNLDIKHPAEMSTCR